MKPGNGGYATGCTDREFGFASYNLQQLGARANELPEGDQVTRTAASAGTTIVTTGFRFHQPAAEKVGAAILLLASIGVVCIDAVTAWRLATWQRQVWGLAGQVTSLLQFYSRVTGK